MLAGEVLTDFTMDRLREETYKAVKVVALPVGWGGWPGGSAQLEGHVLRC